MGELNLEPKSTETSKKKLNWRSPKVIIGVALLIAVPAIGSTLAANIAVNTGNSVEFGQGVVAATACDNDITVTPLDNFDPNAGNFYLSEIDITKLDTAGACLGKRLNVRLWNDTEELKRFAVDPLANGEGSCNTTSSWQGLTPWDACTAQGNSGTSTTGSLQLIFASGAIPLGTNAGQINIKRITVESTDPVV
jgi:hypothetical protein